MRPIAYEGCMVAGFPNYHFVTGPNTGVGSTSIIFMIEQSANLIMNCIKAAGKDGLISPDRGGHAGLRHGDPGGPVRNGLGHFLQQLV